MSNESKKSWISIIVPVIFVIVFVSIPYPESWGFILRFLVTLIPFLIIQYFLSKFLNKKFPTDSDSEG